MKKIALVSITILMLIGMLAAQGKDYPQMSRKPGACGPGRDARMAPRPEWDGTSMDMLKQLNLTSAQTQKLTQLQTSQQKAMNTINAEIENIEIDLRQALKNDDFPAAKNLNDQLHEKKRDKANYRIDHREQIMKELTPEQKDKFQPMFMERQYGNCNGSKNPMPKALNEMDPVQLHRHARQRIDQDCQDCQDCSKTEKTDK